MAAVCSSFSLGMFEQPPVWWPQPRRTNAQPQDGFKSTPHPTRNSKGIFCEIAMETHLTFAWQTTEWKNCSRGWRTQGPFRCYRRRPNTTAIQEQNISAGYQDFQVEIRQGGRWGGAERGRGLPDTVASVSLRIMEKCFYASWIN